MEKNAEIFGRILFFFSPKSFASRIVRQDKALCAEERFSHAHTRVETKGGEGERLSWAPERRDAK